MQLNEMMDYAYKSATETYADHDWQYEHYPTVVAESKDGVFIMGVPWASDAEKVKAIGLLRMIFACKKVERYVMVTEGWKAEVDMKTNPQLAKVMPRDREDRKEVLNITCADVDGEKLGWSFELHRDPEKGVTLGPKEEWPAGSVGGRMAGLLDDLPPYNEIPDIIKVTVDRMLAGSMVSEGE